MKAVVAGNPLVVREVAEPTPGPGQIVVRFRAGSMNPVDWKLATSPVRGPLALWVGRPYVVGSDFAGEIVAVGDGVTLAVGQRVVGRCSPFRGQRGSFAELVLARARDVCALPDAVSFEAAACLPVAGMTAWQSLFDLGHLMPGQRVLILGVTGGVGHLAAQVAHAHGIHVTGVCSAKNAEVARRLGCDEVIDYGAADPLATRGRYHVVLDAVGSYPARRCRAALVPGGVHVDVLPSVGTLAARLLPGKRSHWVRADVSTSGLAPLVAAVAAGQLAPIISARFPLTAVNDAVAMSRAGRTVGKIVLEPG